MPKRTQKNDLSMLPVALIIINTPNFFRLSNGGLKVDNISVECYLLLFLMKAQNFQLYKVISRAFTYKS